MDNLNPIIRKAKGIALSVAAVVLSSASCGQGAALTVSGLAVFTNKPDWPSCLLEPGQEYYSHVAYRFSVE